jgi:hypothetical protein
MDELLLTFTPLFTEPSGLPPSRQCCHLIRLLPYRYAHAQKVELECQCVGMLQQGVIKPSSSAFSAPVLLIKKGDGSWQFCVDYRTLNDLTIKDKFPISVVKELLDEPCGAKFFTKLDLCFGYHYVWISLSLDAS